MEDNFIYGEKFLCLLLCFGLRVKNVNIRILYLFSYS